MLLARRAPSVEARSAIEALEKAGVSVTVAQTDIAISADVAALFERIRTTLPPLRGVLHAAGVVDDGLLAEQNLERFERVMAPKVPGHVAPAHADARIAARFLRDVLVRRGAARISGAK